MTVTYDTGHRGWTSSSHSTACLEDKFEVLRDIGDGSFGSVVLGRTRSAGARLTKRGTLVAIKTMKKTFESFNQCMELREVIFLKSLPNHPHLVPAYDIFLDPLSKKLHIAMEYMDGNLYQLMKARDHKPLDGTGVKSILFQILSGLEHIHEHNFFHRDIKPENILVSTSAPDTGSAFKRYSALVTPPSTPLSYSIKIADFGLARETESRSPYTTYVSTRWYRAPEVLLRAGEYSAPVDIWALGAMAVEIATLKPLFPGGNEVDQVWRVCEIMGSPGNWVNKHGARVGGGEWKDGIRLAQKLGFSFPKMAPHSIDTILQGPHWPASMASFVTCCLMWDPKVRPTSTQALQHEYFADAIDPLWATPAATQTVGRKHTNIGSAQDPSESSHTLSSKTSSWFRKSLVVGRDTPSPAVPQYATAAVAPTLRPAPIHANTTDAASSIKARPGATKRATWTNIASINAAPIPILPSIRPVSPLSDAATAQASTRRSDAEEKASRKIGRQLSVASHGNHYADAHRQEAEQTLNGRNGLASPTSSQRGSFFAHLRKRARRLSGRHQAPMSPSVDDIEASAGCAPWANNRQSMAIESPAIATHATDPSSDPNFAELDRALQNVRYSLDVGSYGNNNVQKPVQKVPSNPMLKRHQSLPFGQDERTSPVPAVNGPISSRTRRSVRQAPHPGHRYETPDEEEELLDEVLASAHRAARRLDRYTEQDNSPLPSVTSQQEKARPPIQQVTSDPGCYVPYLTPSPSKDRNGVRFGQHDQHIPSQPMDIVRPPQKQTMNPQWPTPPYEENEWAAAAAASIFAAGAAYR
ncbi:Serine/threonine protein kinase [Elasticomyces elasticus]|nr:Serine/threonine protein kinase [Elasticomyces elasticus]